MRGCKREFKIETGGRDIQRKRQLPESKTQSKPYTSKNENSPNVYTGRAEAASVPKQSLKVALTSCHPSSCCPAALTSQRVRQPCPCLLLWTSRPWRLGPCQPFSFWWWRSFLSSPSPSCSFRPTSSHPSSTSPVKRVSKSGMVSERWPAQ